MKSNKRQHKLDNEIKILLSWYKFSLKIEDGLSKNAMEEIENKIVDSLKILFKKKYEKTKNI